MILSLFKLADIPIVKHRDIPDTGTVREIILNKKPTGEWFACVTVDGKETVGVPENPQRWAGINVGILKHIHDTDGRAIDSLDLLEERKRLHREQRKLSRKELGSNNGKN